jgi:hypothetical protein
MTESGEIRAGDRVVLRGSDAPKLGKVVEVLKRSAEFRADKPAAGDPGSVPDAMASVKWDGETKLATERLADLTKL